MMLQFEPPTITSIGHAVRWIVTGERCLDYQDALALGDHPKLDDSKFSTAKIDILLALRHKKMFAAGNLEVFDRRYSVFENKGLFGDEFWDSYLSQYSGQVSGVDPGYVFVGRSIDIPSNLWSANNINWNSNCLGHVDKLLNQMRVATICMKPR